MSKAKVVETRRQHARIGVTQSLDACITTTRVEMVVAPNINVVKNEILIGFVANLGSGSSGVSARRNLNQSLTLLTTTIGVVGTPQIVFINMITTIHVNKATN